MNYKLEDYDGGPICPEWWPHILWNLHRPLPWPPKGPNPVNLPVVMNDILCALMAHTSSYYLQDEAAANTIRQAAEKTIIDNVKNMHAAHLEAVKMKTN